MQRFWPRVLAAAGVLALLAAVAQAGHAGDRTGVFDYYLLSLSWSPTYCLTHRDDMAQCGSKGYGLVLHGLWPQFAAGGYPRDCRTALRLTRKAVAFGKTIFPSPKLIRHEWYKHGTCSGLGALDYFRAADRARSAVSVPKVLESPDRTRRMTAAEIAAAVRSVNPRMPAQALVVQCRGPELAEIRICLDRGLGPTACGKGVRSRCRAGRIRIPAVR